VPETLWQQHELFNKKSDEPQNRCETFARLELVDREWSEEVVQRLSHRSRAKSSQILRINSPADNPAWSDAEHLGVESGPSSLPPVVSICAWPRISIPRGVQGFTEATSSMTKATRGLWSTSRYFFRFPNPQTLADNFADAAVLHKSSQKIT
jgi:hypothetical protein